MAIPTSSSSSMPAAQAAGAQVYGLTSCPTSASWHVACNVLRQLEIEGLLHALTVRLAQLIRVVIQGEALESGVTCHEQSMQA